MIPIKDKIYKISFISPEDSNLDYIGEARYTGDSEGDLFFFKDLTQDRGSVDFAYFSEEDIVSLVDK
jgi:hypothetical protein